MMISESAQFHFSTPCSSSCEGLCGIIGVPHLTFQALNALVPKAYVGAQLIIYLDLFTFERLRRERIIG